MEALLIGTDHHLEGARPMARKHTTKGGDVPAWKAIRKRDFSLKIGDPSFRGSPNLYAMVVGKVRAAKGKAPDGHTWTLVPRRNSTLYIDTTDRLFSDDVEAYHAMTGDARKEQRAKNRARAEKALKQLA
jgi:hypothetical protein